MKKTLYFFVLLCLAFLMTACGQETSQPRKAELDKPAPDFTLVDTKGNTWKLSDLKGQVVFVNFWATWCPPCRAEMPSMQELYTTMPADTFKMLAILSNDDPALADRFAAKIGCTFPILVDPEGLTGRAYGLTGVPETFIIDKKGIIREKFIGATEWNSPAALQIIRKYLNQ